MARPKPPLYCSFCRKDQTVVQALVAGPGVYICNECVDSCNRVIAGKPARSSFPGWDSLSTEALLRTLGPSATAVDTVRDVLQDHVNLLRTRSVSWSQIGEALGISRQAAWERFS